MIKELRKMMLTIHILIITWGYVNAQNATFNNNGGDNLWSNTANWNTGVLPTGIATITENVTLDIDVSVTQIITPNNLTKDIKISGTKTITIGAGGPVWPVNNRLDGILTLECKIVIDQTGKSISSSFFPNNKLVFATGSELTLNKNTNIRNFSANTMDFNGELKGSANFIVATTTDNGGLIFGSTADNSAFEGQFITYKEDITSNITSPNLFFSVNSKGIQFNNTDGSITINQANTITGSIARTNTNSGTSVVNINANQTNMDLLNVSATSAGAILELNIDDSVTELSFSGINLGTESTSGKLNIVGFKDDVLKFGSDLTQDQLDVIQIEGTASEGFLTQRENGFLVKTTSLNVKKSFIETTKFYPNPANTSLYIDSPEKNSISLYNILGLKVKTVENKSGKSIINLTDVNPGIYLIMIEVGDQSKTEKLIIN